MAGVILAIGGFSVTALATEAAGAPSGVTISTAKNAKLGTILVSGKTVYTLKAGKTSCGAKCLKTWPEVLLPAGATSAVAGTGVSATSLGTVAGAGGALQVTYSGKPLYFFFKDKAPGQVRGIVTDKWGKWSVVVTVKPAKSSSSSGSSGSNAGSGGAGF
jgi:predicted lipoprotein with Yx(FWY)xxD motif